MPTVDRITEEVFKKYIEAQKNETKNKENIK